MFWQQLDTVSKSIFMNFIGLMETCIQNTHPDSLYYFERIQDDCYFSPKIPFPLMNGIASFSSDLEYIDRTCDKLIHRFKKSQCPVTWFWPHAEEIPANIQSVFEKHGFKSMGQYLSIAVERKKINDVILSVEDNTTIQRVETSSQFDDFLQITKEVYGMPDVAFEPMARLYSAWQYNNDIKLYLALVDEKPVSTLLCYENNKTMGLYNGATLESHRKQGLLTNLIIHAVKQVDSVDFVVAQLMASQNAKGVCDQLGFETFSHFTPLCSGFDLETMKA